LVGLDFEFSVRRRCNLAVSVLLADDSDVFRHALRRCFEGRPEIVVVGEASDFSQAVRLSEQLRPDVVLLDLRMRDSHGLDALAASPKLISSGATIVAISFSCDDEAKDLAKQIGAAKLLDKVNLYTELVGTILGLKKLKGHDSV
jgi:DNA-binding NarL/FixJ family response regulator